MSLQRLLLRTSVVRALKNKTIAGAMVFDSGMSPQQTQADNNRLPSINVYTQADSRTQINDSGSLPPIFRAEIDLQIELTIGGWQEIEVPGPQGNPELVNAYVTASTDAELEAMLDMLELQVRTTIFGADEEVSPLQRMVQQWKAWNSIPGRSDSGNEKYAAREILIPVQLRDDCMLPIDGTTFPKGPRGDTIFPPLETAAPYLKPLLRDLAKMPAYQSLRVLLQQLYGTEPLPKVDLLTSVGMQMDFNGDGTPEVVAPFQAE